MNAWPVLWMTPRQPVRPEALPKDLPDYCVYMTRQSLLCSTTTLSRVSTEMHDFFLQLRYMLAFDRFMRSFFPWMPSSASMWRSATMMPQALPAPQQCALLPFYGANPLMQLPSPQPQLPHPSAFAPFGGSATYMPSPQAAMLSATAAFVAVVTPAVMDAWRMAV